MLRFHTTGLVKLVKNIEYSYTAETSKHHLLKIFLYLMFQLYESTFFFIEIDASGVQFYLLQMLLASFKISGLQRVLVR